MDKVRVNALKALFGKGLAPDKSHVEVLLQNLTLDQVESEELFANEPEVFNNFTMYLADAQSYIADLEGNSPWLKIYLQRLSGLPEDPEPKDDQVKPELAGVPYKRTNVPLPQSEDPPKDSKQKKGKKLDKKTGDKKPAAKTPANTGTDNPSPQQNDGKPPQTNNPEPPAPATDPAQQANPTADARQIALTQVFDRDKKQFTRADLSAIGSRSKPERTDVTALDKLTYQRLQLFDKDPEGMIDSVDPDFFPGFTPIEISQYQTVLKQLLILRVKASEWRSYPGQETTPVQKPSVVINLEATPAWVRELNRTPYWQLARTKIEEAFFMSCSTDSKSTAKGCWLLHLWKERMYSHRDGGSGQDLMRFGERMLKCIRELEAGADPTSDVYRKLYVQT